MNIKRSHILVTAIVLLVFFMVMLLLGRTNTGTLTVIAPSKTPDNADVSVQILRDGAEEQSLTLKPGESREVRLKNGTIRVDGQAGNLKSVDIITINSLRNRSIKTPSGEQRSIQQIASDATYCPIIAAGAIYSYGCDGEGPITYHESNTLGTSLNTILFEGVSFSGLKPLKGGLIGFYATAGSAANIQFVDLAAKTVTNLDLPDNVEKLMVDQPEIATSSDPDDSRFALVFSAKNKIYVFDDITDASPIEIKPGADVKLNHDGRRVRMSFYGNNPILYAGVSTGLGEGSASTQTNDPRPELDAYLFEYDSGGTLTKTLSVPEEVDAGGIYKLNDGFYAADQAHGFGFYRATDKSLEHVYTIDDMSSWTIFDNRTYVEAGGTIYEFTPGKNGLFSLRSLFSSTTITTSGLYTYSEGILFTGLTNTDSNAPLNVYKLLAKGQKPPKTANTGSEVDSITEPLITGQDTMLYYGISSFQADNLLFALSNYATTIQEPVATLAMVNIEPVPHDPFSASTVDTIHFDLTVNGTDTLKGTLEYFDLSAIRLYLRDETSGALLYDSQVIDHKEPPSYNPEPEH